MSSTVKPKLPSSVEGASTSLQKAFDYCCEKSKLQNSKLPARIQQELLDKCLYIAELETNPGEIELLCMFMRRPEALKQIETLIIAERTSFGKAHNRRCSEYKPGKVSCLYLDNCRLFRTLIAFVLKCQNLKRLIIDSVHITEALLVKLAVAISNTPSQLRWFGVKSTPIGDDGFNILVSALARRNIQVIAFENCELTDDSCDGVARLIKSQENKMDTAYWNATLRAPVTDFYVSSETEHVLSSGTVAISLVGNRISGRKLGPISDALKKNYWFLGLNLSNNLLTADEIMSFLKYISGNNVIHTIILGNNPGFTLEAAALSTKIISRNNSRLHYLPHYLEEHIRRWIEIQLYDGNLIGDYSFSRPNNDSLHNPEEVGETLDIINDMNNAQELPIGKSAEFNLDDIEDDGILNDLDRATPGSPNLSDFIENDIVSAIFPDRDQLDMSASKEEVDGRPPSRISIRPRKNKSNNDPIVNTVGELIESYEQRRIQSGSRDFSPPQVLSRLLHVQDKSHTAPNDTDHNNRPKSSSGRKRPTSAPSSKSVPLSREDSPLDRRRSTSPAILPYTKLTGKITTARKSEYHPRKAPTVAKNSIARRKSTPKPQPKNQSIRSHPLHAFAEEVLTLSRRASTPQRSISPKQVKQTQSLSDSASKPKSRRNSTNKSAESPSSAELTGAIISATNSLVLVTNKLQEVASSLSETLQMHSQLVSSQLQESIAARQSAGHIGSHLFTPFSANNALKKESPERSPGSARSPASLRNKIASSYRDIEGTDDEVLVYSDPKRSEARPNSLSNAKPVSSKFESDQDISNLRDSFSVVESDPDVYNVGSMDDQELTEVIRQAMAEKLTNLFSSKSESVPANSSRGEVAG